MSNQSRQQKNQRNSGMIDSLKAYFLIHAHTLFSSLGRLLRNPFASAMTIMVMAIAISLAAGFYLMVVNMQQLTGNIEATNQISIFLKPTVSDAAGKSLAEQIRGKNKVQQVKLITKGEAFDEFKAYSGFGDALNVLETNPLPVVIQVLPKNTLSDLQAIENLMTSLDQLPQVDFVQLDMQWIKRLQSIVQIIQRGVFLLTVLLALAVLFITGNTIRLELQNRRDEVLVEKLVGATHSFIRRPFLYTGFWLGFLSSFLALILVTIMMFVLQQPIERLSNLYSGSFNMVYLGFFDSIMLFLIASVLGIVGAWGVLHYQLQQIKPE